ncbi:protein-L-isoaspartate O-methyltransferase [bacterium]|nr:MAG: protein-L-isoaspartate O-methyltransferase [bacterium]
MEGIVDYKIARKRMVNEQLFNRGITDRRVLKAFLTVPRHLFVDPGLGSRAYDDSSFPIGYSQTISQPYTIALMVQALQIAENDRVLEIGTGSGYQTAILSLLAKEVFSIERLKVLFEKASKILGTLKRGRINLKLGDGSLGWQSRAPFDRIIVSASMKEKPVELLNQLTDGGRLVAPIYRGTENIFLFTKEQNGISQTKMAKCSFVPLKRGEA